MTHDQADDQTRGGTYADTTPDPGDARRDDHRDDRSRDPRRPLAHVAGGMIGRRLRAVGIRWP